MPHAGAEMKSVAASVVLICSLAAAQSNNNRRGASTFATADASVATLSRRVDALFAPLRDGARPGAVVFVGREGTVLQKKAYGMADVSQPIPLTSATVFYLGSIGKSFTALAI